MNEDLGCYAAVVVDDDSVCVWQHLLFQCGMREDGFIVEMTGTTIWPTTEPCQWLGFIDFLQVVGLIFLKMLEQQILLSFLSIFFIRVGLL